ncbi:MAG: UDP-N-acetylglucosamine 2-epimerase (non-hydrolyzing) [Saprospiraceae bacterium]|nr:UDP-N-acetylglucosamine 2-epimerase (non-hydrolyzing) [Saprospiraceae bacterium]
MKLAPVYEAMSRRGAFEQRIVHTGQHYNNEMTIQFNEDFNLPFPDINLNVGSQRHLIQLSQMLIGLDKELMDNTPDMAIVYGDTNTTAAGAIAASKLNIPLAHVEAGLREWDKSIPEEINKLLIDAVTDIYFCPSITAKYNLNNTGTKQNVHLTGDVVLSYMLNNTDRIIQEEGILSDLRIIKNQYYLATCHRAANTDNKKKLSHIIYAFQRADKPVVFIMHPRTSNAIEKYNLKEEVDHKNIKVISPQSFWKTQCLTLNASKVLTDSGGLIKESFLHKVPSVILDTQTEWVEIVESGWAHISGPDAQEILRALRMKPPENEVRNMYLIEKAPEKVAEIIYQYLTNHN